MLGRDSEDEIYQDLCLNLRYELNPRVRCAFGNVLTYVGPPPPLSINVQRNCTFGIGIICIAPPLEKKTFPVHPYKFPWVHPPSMRTNRKKATMLRDGDLG